MRFPFGVVLFSILLSIISFPQNNISVFPEKQLIDKSILAGKNNKININLNSITAAKTDILTSDTLISDIVSSINADSVKKFISGLQSFGSRFAYSPNRDQVALWIKQQYLNMGFTDVVIDSFYLNGTWQKNVIATLPGKNTNEICIVGGHYDSIISTIQANSPAPGADDNASGTTMPLEIARVFKKMKYTPECTVKFLAFGAEELGLLGSADYAAKCLQNGTNIKLMINADMISYTSKPVSSSTVSIYYYSGCESWLGFAKSMMSKYSQLTPVNGGLNSSGSDSYSFWKKGYQVIYYMESQFSPFYHSTADTIGNYSMPYCAEIIKGACALLINACGMPSNVQNLSLIDLGNGKSLKAQWKKSTSYDLKYYKVYVGKSTNNYDTTFTTTDTSRIITGLKDGQLVFVAVSAISNSGYESALVEKNIKINSVPASPSIQISSTSRNKVSLVWSNANFSVNFAGYNIYRSDSLNGVFKKLNTSILTDTLFSDNTINQGKFYYYFVTSLFDNGAESGRSNVISARLISLDKGIGLLITTDTTMSDPGLDQLHSFFSKILQNYKYQIIAITDQQATISDMSIYSTVIWYNHSNASMPLLKNSQNEIKKYIDAGGKIIISTNYPTNAFSNIGSTVKTFTSGSFIYDYMKIASSKSQFTAHFSGALHCADGYEDLPIDTTKTSSDYAYQLSGVEAISPNSSGRPVYLYDSKESSNSLKDLPVAVEYIGNDYKLMLMSFPLYYIKQEKLKTFFSYVLGNKFAEQPSAINNNSSSEIPSEYSLLQNYPNPFNPETTIEYNLPIAGSVSLRIFDVLGREIKTLLQGDQPAGKHSVSFNAAGLSSGIYYYKLQSGTFVQTRKMILVK